jgi:D-alanine-D-alanine ligase-like ATP-grasp enzyme
MYVNNKFFSCAILSQEDTKTKVDFRNYNSINPNKIVPIKLPKIVEESTKRLMNFYKLDYASIDFVYCSERNKFVFLEANPIGQFLQFSQPCNFNIEKEIATFLTKKHYEAKEKNNII